MLHTTQKSQSQHGLLCSTWGNGFSRYSCGVLWCLVVVVLGITIIGIPFAIYFAVRWGFIETLLLEGISVRHALKRSSELVNGGDMWDVACCYFR